MRCPGGCDTGGWFHLSDIRRNRRFNEDLGCGFWTVGGVGYRDAFYKTNATAMQIIVMAAIDIIQEDMMKGQVPRLQICACATLGDDGFQPMRPFAIRALHGRNGWPQLDMFRTSYHVDLDALAESLERCFVLDTSCPVQDVLRDGLVVKERGDVPFI